jgi:cytochrome c oxidase subunit 1
MHYEGLAGVPRRYLDLRDWHSFNKFDDLNKMITVVSIISICNAADVCIQFLLFNFQRKKSAYNEPMGFNTLEWTTPINPGHGNWPGEIPEVHRWAYDYGKDGREFHSQTEPVGPNETDAHAKH